MLLCKNKKIIVEKIENVNPAISDLSGFHTDREQAIHFFSVHSKWNAIIRAETSCALRTACDSRTSSGHGAEGNKTDLHD